MLHAWDMTVTIGHLPRDQNMVSDGTGPQFLFSAAMLIPTECDDGINLHRRNFGPCPSSWR
jgi:hypothetical protein